MDGAGSGSLRKRIGKAAWVTVGFSVLGYTAAVVLQDARWAMVVAACAVIPVGAKSPTVWKGLLWGAGLGFMSGAGIYTASTYGRSLNPDIVQHILLKSVLGTMVLCAGVAAAFAFLARARRASIERRLRQ